jgi:hypothetical protein
VTGCLVAPAFLADLGARFEGMHAITRTASYHGIVPLQLAL